MPASNDVRHPWLSVESVHAANVASLAARGGNGTSGPVVRPPPPRARETVHLFEQDPERRVRQRGQNQTPAPFVVFPSTVVLSGIVVV